MKKIEIEIPDGKTLELRDGAYVIVDAFEYEDIKSFEDAYNKLGKDHPLIKEFDHVMEYIDLFDKSSRAYCKLKIITAALNDDWKPTFESGEYRYYPWFRVLARSCYSEVANGGVSCTYASSDASYASANYGSRLAFKTKELAEYAGKQFEEFYKDFILLC